MEKPTGINVTNSTGLMRTGRKNYGLYPSVPLKHYGSIGEYKDDSDEDSEPSPNESSQKGYDPNFNEYKVYHQYSNYGPLSYSPNNNGDFSSFPSWGTSNQKVQMMMALKNLADVEKPEETGIFSKLMSDPKIVAAAFIPLSIVAAAIVPVLINSLKGGNTTPMVSTTANSREFKRLDATKNFEMLVENMAMLARAVENDDCIQKTICRIARGESNIPMVNYVRNAASTVAHMIKDDWLDNLRIKILVDAVKDDNCENVCSSFMVTPRIR
ncbi:uncharacterized protein TNIN_12911 [Trichonephila inaurata madagascariensis]|uniref:Uncharacterized protein n=1 Tax=Trichonephila inaurata madagascariensis TaxID=2747483 RepID=A0A8X6YK73_9ARAC|nr:uncharacterized protein TNIN_12911 [Trichonephila inaurata madagascariensis]